MHHAGSLRHAINDAKAFGWNFSESRPDKFDWLIILFLACRLLY
jgi:hypothetical protein